MKKKKFFTFCAAAALLLGTDAANAAKRTWDVGSTKSGLPPSTDVVATLDDDGTFTITGTGAMVGYAVSSSTVSRPPWYDYRAAIKTLVINEGVTSIGSYAFYQCGNLTSVTIGNSVTYIGSYAFCACGGLTSVTIPDGVTSIGNSAFLNCKGLTSVTIPNKVTSIGDQAFDQCSGLTSVTIGNSVTSIGSQAFTDCSGLTAVFCLAAKPPRLVGSSNFTALYGDAYVDALYVPASALDAYKSNSAWKNAFDIILAIESATSIKTVDANKLHVYPNPTTGIVYVDNANGAEIKVYNLSGALLHRTRESRVDLSGEPSGIYLLRVGGETLKVVKK